MPNLRTINGRSGGADFKIGTQSYKKVVTNQRFEANTNQDDETTFGDEPDPKYGEGQSSNRFAYAGIMKQGDVEADPIMPSSNQGVSVTQIFSTGNQMSYTANFSRLVLERSALQKGIIAGEGLTTSAIVKTWNTTT